MSNRKNSNLFLIIGIVFVTCLLISNIASFKLIQLGKLAITSSVLLFPVTYIFNDLIAEVYGFQKAKLIIWLGFAMNFFMVVYFQLTIALPYPAYFENQAPYATVLGNTVRALSASLAAYAVGSFMNATIMSKLKVKYSGRGLFGRAIISTIVGEALDSVIFVCILFGGLFTWDQILIMIGTQTIFKTAYEIVIFPVTNIVIKKVKKYEGIDVYDYNVSYNPFKRGE